jgi:hypothetical protein
LQAVSLIKRSVALSADKRLFFRVSSHMLIQIAGLTK